MHIVPQALDEPGFVGGVHAVRLRAGKGFFQKLRGEDLRRLREHQALARNRPGNQGHVLRQAGALHFFHRVHRGDAQNRGVAAARFLDDPRNLLDGDERPHGVVHQHNFRVVRHLA